MDNITYNNIPDIERHQIQQKLYSTAYPASWVAWGRFYLNDEIEDVLSKTFESLKKYSNQSIDEETSDELYEKFYPAILNTILSNYTETFREEHIEGGSWEQDIHSDIESVINIFCDKLGIIKDF